MKTNETSSSSNQNMHFYTFYKIYQKLKLKSKIAICFYLIIISIYIFFITENDLLDYYQFVKDKEFQLYIFRFFKTSIILSTLSKSYISLALNMYYTFTQKFNITNHLYLSFDHSSYSFLKKYISDNIYYYNINLKTNDKCNYGSNCYSIIIKYRLYLIKVLLNLNFNVLIIDPDIHFFKNPLNYFSCADYDIIATCDNVKIINAGFLY